MNSIFTVASSKALFLFLVFNLFFFELTACDKNIFGAVSSPNNLINSGEIGCVTGNFSGSITVNAGGVLRICGQYTFSGAINVATGAKVIITEGSSVGVVGSLTFNDFESLEYEGDPACNAEIYAITANSCFVTWGAVPGVSGAFCKSNNIYLNGFIFAWGAGSIGSANNGLAPFLCPGGGHGACETSLLFNALDFDAQKRGQTVLLEWSATTDMEDDFFSIERSSAGFDWEEIARMDVIRNKPSSEPYSFTDKWPLHFGTYYRIRQEKMNGQSSYSNTEYISGFAKEYNFSIYPNPSNGKFNLNLGKSHNFDNLKIMDSMGAVIQQTDISDGPLKEIDMTNYDNGLYFIEISGKDAVITRRIQINNY